MNTYMSTDEMIKVQKAAENTEISQNLLGIFLKEISASGWVMLRFSYRYFLPDFTTFFPISLTLAASSCPSILNRKVP